MPEEAPVHIAEILCQPRDRLLLCTDGLSGLVQESEITRALTHYLDDKQQVAATGMTRGELAAALVARGQNDN